MSTYSGITIQPSEELFFKSLPRTLDYELLSGVYYPRVRAMPTPIVDDIFQHPASPLSDPAPISSTCHFR